MIQKYYFKNSTGNIVHLLSCQESNNSTGMMQKIKDINKEDIVASAWQVTDLFHWYNKKEIFSKFH
jgi:hypothetical protein